MEYLNTILRPMHTAPKTGEFILLYGDSGYTTFPYRVVVSFWENGKEGWFDHANDRFTDGGEAPMFWSPLPVDPLAFQNTDPNPIGKVPFKQIDEQVKKEGYCFTFLTHHEHPTRYIKVLGTVEEARGVMFDRFGDKWGFMHPVSMEQEMIDWGLTELK